VAKSGTTSSVAGSGNARSAGTRQTLVEAAIETLKAEGYAGASARAIAARAGMNQGLIFYHFGSVATLLLAALDEVSSQRQVRYGEAVEGVGSLGDLVSVANEVFSTDLDAGYITVLVEMIAGASSTPGLAEEVAARIAPWRDFAGRAVASALGDSPLAAVLPAGDIAYAIVALYLGLEMLTHLDGDREPALRLFELVRQGAALTEAMLPAPPRANA